MGSIVVRMGIGALLLVGALILLWINEGRVDFGRIAASATVISPEQIDKDADGKLVSIQGMLKAETALGDEPFLRSGPYIQLERNVEFFVWNEEKREGAGRSTGANSGEKDPRDYEYTLEWSDEPEDSADFADPIGHENPAQSISDETLQVAQARIGPYTVDPRSMDLPKGQELLLDDKKVSPEKISAGHNRSIEGKYLFEGSGTLEQPQVGDLRVWYEVVPDAVDVTLFGQLAGDRIVPYVDRRKNQLYRALALSPEAAIQQMSSEYRNLLWGLRFFGTLLMWGGLLLIVSPLTNLFSWIPLVGSLGRLAIGAFTFVLALLLSIMVMIISYITHTPLLLVAIVLLIGGGIFYLLRKKRQAEEQGG